MSISVSEQADRLDIPCYNYIKHQKLKYISRKLELTKYSDLAVDKISQN